MTLTEIKQAVEQGKKVHWSSEIYQVVKDGFGQWFIHCQLNDHYIGLTWKNGKTMNGNEEDFFIAQ